MPNQDSAISDAEILVFGDLQDVAPNFTVGHESPQNPVVIQDFLDIAHSSHHDLEA